MAIVLHLTHTNVPTDARILRELNALWLLPDVHVEAYGVLDQAAPKTALPFGLREFRVRSNDAHRLARAARYALVLIEVNARFISRLLRLRPDVVHCHDTMVLPSAVVAKLLQRSTVVYDAHELESDKAGQSAALSKATLLLEKISWPHIDRLITVSPSIAAWYADHLGPKPTWCILNSPELSGVTHADPARSKVGGVRAVLGIGDHEPLFVYVGALEPGRGLELLVDTFAQSITGSHIVFVGAGSLRDVVRGAAAEHRNIHYTPPVPHDELVAFIKGATGGFCLIEDVSLSDHLCLPNKLFEYAFAGLPVIASRLPDIQRVVEQYQLGLCADLTATSVRAAVVECNARSENLPQERLEPLSWERQASDLRSLYADILHSDEVRVLR